jgi:hypothetical protein
VIDISFEIPNAKTPIALRIAGEGIPRERRTAIRPGQKEKWIYGRHDKCFMSGRKAKGERNGKIMSTEGQVSVRTS